MSYYPANTAAGWRDRMEQRADETFAGEVPAHRIRADVRQAAELWTDAVSLSLGMPCPAIKWLPLDADVRGRVEPDDLKTIWVKPQELPDLVDTIGHECRHRWQLQPDAFRWTQKGLDTDEGCERDAGAYGLGIKSAYVEGRPLPLPDALLPTSAGCPTAVAAQRYAPAPDAKLGIYEFKGIRFRDCPQCDDAVALGTSHRCPATYRAAHR
jgi:hypothetical protein